MLLSEFLKDLKGSKYLRTQDAGTDGHEFCRLAYQYSLERARREGIRIPLPLSITFTKVGTNRQYFVQGSGGFGFNCRADCSWDARRKAIESLLPLDYRDAEELTCSYCGKKHSPKTTQWTKVNGRVICSWPSKCMEKEVSSWKTKDDVTFSETRKEGVRAAQERKSLKHNPYPQGSRVYVAWEIGWKDYRLTRDVLPEVNFQGLRIAIEQQPGTVRSGTREDGTPWETKFFYSYGFIRGTEGADSEEIDCFVGPNPDSPKVFIIHQRNSAGYDEDKVMLGFESEEHARDAYLAHFDTQEHLGPISEMTVEEYRTFLGIQGTTKVPQELYEL